MHDPGVTGPVLTDGVVRLRQLTAADAAEWLAGEDEELIRGFESPRPSTREDVDQAIERWTEWWRTGGPVRHWAICDIDGATILGGVEIRRLEGTDVNLSYVVFPAARRRGIATRAARLALDHAAAEMGARAAVIKVLEGNLASLGVARRLSAAETGRTPSDAGGTFIVFRLELTGAATAPKTERPARGGSLDDEGSGGPGVSGRSR